MLWLPEPQSRPNLTGARMPGLVFRNVDRYWQGNDYKDVAEKPAEGGKPAKPAEHHRVSMTSVAVGTDEPPFALIFMTHMNIDFDGAGNAYGPDNLEPLDYLLNAGQKTHYYGLMSVLPTAGNPVDKNGMIKAPDGTRVKVDPARAGQTGISSCRSANGAIRGILRLGHVEEEPRPRRQQLSI